jgi:putative ABC transport system substrate-binding protein
MRASLRRLGYEEGRNVVIEVHFGEFDVERTAAEIVAGRPAVIVAQGRAINAVVRRTKSIPIVSGFSGDFVESGLAASLARPGGNVTGIQLLYFDLVGKRIEVLKEIMPLLKRIAVVASPFHPGVHRERDETEAAAKKLGIAVSYHPVKSASELDGGLQAVRAAGAQAIVSFPDGITFPMRGEIAAFAIEHGMATVSGWDGYADAGHLVIYGPSLQAVWARMAHYVDRILKGANPADLPVELPATFELVVNLKTARSLGLKVPQSVLLRADRVIE